MSKFSQIPESGFPQGHGAKQIASENHPVADPGERPGEPPPPLFLLFLVQTEARTAEKKFFRDRPLPYLKVRHCHSRSTHIFQFPLSVKNRRYIRVLWMFKLFLAKKPQVNLHGNLKRQTGNGIFI